MIVKHNGEMKYVKAKKIEIAWHGFYAMKHKDDPNARWVLTLFNVETREPLLHASVNLPKEPLARGHTFIKNHSENEGVLQFLINNHVIEDTGQRVKTGYVEVAVVKVLI